MNRYIKLVNFELKRFMKVYLALIVITILAQTAGVILTANEYLGRANKAIYEELVPATQFIEQYGQFSFLNIARTTWFMGPIALSAAALIFYIFMIWYRDWFGKNTFIYRLLMLPTARLNVLLSKATSIFLMVLGLVSVQYILLPFETAIMNWRVPAEFRADLPIQEIIQNFPYLSILLPQSFLEFVLYYGAGFMVITMLFAAILFERSFRWKGILIGVGYVVLSAVVFLTPLLTILFTGEDYLYPLEMLAAEIILGVVVMCFSIWLGNHLLNKKITV
ncbi:hypothetical protein ACFO3D_15015 [Virgibacillus kekensis]|uniref:ABC-2 family transporter protein n=1 Tax=Virgibacillus kekensis TaxID=202261 RepID=A0ABV9DN52_9BACI